MKINFPNTSFSQQYKNNYQSTPSFPSLLNRYETDTVTFGSKKKSQKPHQHNNQQSPQNTKFSKLSGKRKIRVSQGPDRATQELNKLEKLRQKEALELAQAQAQLEKEHKKAELKKLYLTPNLRESIVANTVSEKRVNFIINKLKEYPELIGEFFFEPNGGGLMTDISDSLAKSVLANTQDYNTLLKLITTTDGNKNLFIEKASLSKIKILNEELQMFPDLLRILYTTPNKQKQLPAHYLPIDGLEEMNKALGNYPLILREIYTTQDSNGNTPLHRRFKKAHALVREALKYQPEVLTKIRKIQNNHRQYSDTLLNQQKNYNGPYKDTWNEIIENN